MTNIKNNDLEKLMNKFNIHYKYSDTFIIHDKKRELLKGFLYAEAMKFADREIPLYFTLLKEYVIIGDDFAPVELEDEPIDNLFNEGEDIKFLNNFFAKLYINTAFNEFTYEDKHYYCMKYQNFQSDGRSNLIFNSLLLLNGCIFIFKDKYKSVLSHPDEVNLLTGLLFDFDANKASETFEYKISGLPEIEELLLNDLDKLQLDIEKNLTQRLDEQIISANRRIEDLLNEIQMLKQDLRTYDRERFAILSVSSDTRMDEIAEYIKMSSQLRATGKTETGLEVTVLGTIKVWKEEYLNNIIETNYRNEFINVISSRTENADGGRLLFKKIFETREVKLHTFATFIIDFVSARVSRVCKSSVIQVDEGVAIPNVHINRYDCWSAAQEAVYNFLNTKRYNEALQQLVFATESLNLTDGTVMGQFAKDCLDNKCLEYKGKFYKASTLIPILCKEEEK